ncbi:MAG TPA: mechanosensitive ion channel family protein [Actinomycetota bacterium]|nr:mechanosensitive ion channel family protein [Actinomycetota bacterium]
MEGSLTLRDLVETVAWLGGAVVVGLFLRFMFGRLERRAGATRWSGDEVLYAALADLALSGAVAVGAWATILALPLREGVRDIAERALVAALILLATVIVARLGARLIRAAALGRPGVAQSSSIFVNITRLVVFAVGFLVFLQTLGVSIAPLLTALGVGGLAVALALQDTLSNLFAGIHILASKKVQPGDFIRLDSGEEGYVVDINWRNTWIRQLPNNMVLVPNARLASAIVTNYYRPERELAVLLDVGVDYESDLAEVERVTMDVAAQVMRDVDGGVPGFEPFIRYHTFGDSSINFTTILRAREFTDQYLIKHEFVKRLHERFRAEGITIPFPIRTVHLHPADRSGPAAE